MTSHRLVLPVLIAVAGSSLVLAAPAPSAHAAPDPTAALGLPSGVSATVQGSGAVATKSFDDFPSNGADYYVLSTGVASQALPATPDPDAQLSTDHGADGIPDTSTLTLTVDDASGAGCLFVDFALGTEEPVHTYVYNPAQPATGGDRLSVTQRGVTTEGGELKEYAVNAGRAYFSQEGWAANPEPYAVNAIKYWHHPGDPTEPIPGTAEEPWLAEASALNSVTTRDTARVPLDLTAGDAVIDITVSDVANGDLDSVALLDHVRLGNTCSAGTGVEPNPVHDGGVIAGIRGVGNALVYDPIPSTDAIERYDDPGNGWRSPSNVPVELRFRWYRTYPTYAHNGAMTNWVPIPDADRQAYVPTAVDRDKVLICLVTGVVDGRRYETFPSTGEALTWYVTTPIDKGTFLEGEAPIINGPENGVPKVGDVLAAQVGHTVPREDTWAWRWFADGSPISGATGQTYTVGAAQAGTTITVEATAKRLNFVNKSWMSEPYGPIQPQTWSATDVPTIVVDGSPAYGKTLTVDPGDGWRPVPDRYSYQWKRNGSVVPNATFANYTIRADDVGAQITVMVSGVKTGFAADPKESAPVSIQGATMTGATPVVTGTPQVGTRLTGLVTDWDPSGSMLTYKWYADGTLVHEGSTSLTVPASAAGKRIVLEVTGRRTGYTPLTKSSVPTQPVSLGTLTTRTPTISGYAKVGQTLTANPGYWGPSGVKLSYRWKVGKNQVTGRKGARPTFVIPRTARGKRITVLVTGTLAGYSTAKLVSTPTAMVVR